MSYTYFQKYYVLTKSTQKACLVCNGSVFSCFNVFELVLWLKKVARLHQKKNIYT